MDINVSNSGFLRDIDLTYRPLFFNLNNNTGQQGFNKILESDSSVQVCNQILDQLKDLIKCRNPSKRIESEEYIKLIKSHLSGRELNTYGIWVYYPWCRRMVHILDEEEFIEVRTNRNKYKLTDKEQQVLKHKIIGIIGLSVGQSIALTLAMERTCGELRLADFDTIELSNLNRIRTGVQSLGLKKTIVAAREIAEIDPFLKVKVFSEGLTYENIDSFFTEDGKLDLLVEVCDSLDIKINCRYKAKELNIPVVMDTNDRGMLDIERFDRDPQLPILHGLAAGLNPDNIKDLRNEEKIPHILKMVGAATLSPRLKASMLEVESTICTWPQLASSVVLGGAVTTDVCRRILLNQLSVSGRYYIDLEELIKEPEPGGVIPEVANSFGVVDRTAYRELIDEYSSKANTENDRAIVDALGEIQKALMVVPNFGGEDRVAYTYENGSLFVIKDLASQTRWLDPVGIEACLTLGTSLESLALKSVNMGLMAQISLPTVMHSKQLIASITFSSTDKNESSGLEIPLEFDHLESSEVMLPSGESLPLDFYKQIEYFVAEFQGIEIDYTDGVEDINQLAHISGDLERRILLDEHGHTEYFKRLKMGDAGNDTAEPGGNGKFSVFDLAEDWEAMKILRDLDSGSALRMFSMQETKSALGIILVRAAGLNVQDWVNAGRVFERLYRYTSSHGISIEPLTSINALFNRYRHGDMTGLGETVIGELSSCWEQFKTVFSKLEDNNSLFLIKLGGAGSKRLKYRRRNKEEIYQIG